MGQPNSYLDAVNGSANPLMSALYMAKRPGDLVNQYHQAVMRDEQGVPVVLREAIAAFVSGLNMCPLCHQAHTRVAELLGYDRSAIEQLKNDIAAAAIDEAERPLFQLAKVVTLAPSTLEQADIDRAKNAGWSEQQIHNVLSVVSLFNYINRFVLGHGIRVNAKGVETSAQVLAKVGYWSDSGVPDGA